MMVASIAFVAPSVEAKSPSSVEAEPQIRVQVGPQRRNNRRVYRRVQFRTYTRIVGYGRNRFRETVRVAYLPNGRTRTQVISRTRIGRNY